SSVHAMQKVVDLYTGDLLPSCYDEWIATPRERLRLDFLSVMDKLVDALESAGDLSLAIVYAQRLLRHDPFSEENYRRLMQLYLENGDLAGVMSVYRNCTRMLRRELNMEPGEATHELARRAQQFLGSAGPSTRRRDVGRTRAGGTTGAIET